MEQLLNIKLKTMKKIMVYIIFICALGLLTLNFNITNHNTMKNDLSLENVKALQAAAGEMWCDQTNDVECRIEYGDAVGISKGILRAEW